MFEQKFSSKAVGPIVAVSLLFLVAVVGFFVFERWYIGVQQDKFSQVYSIGQVSDLKIMGVDTDSVFVTSYVGEKVVVYDVLVENYSCSVSLNLTPNSLNEIYLGSCVEQYGNFSRGGMKVSLRTGLGVFSRQVSFDDALSFVNLTNSTLEILSSSEGVLDSLVVKNSGGGVVCSFSGREFTNYSGLVAKFGFDGVEKRVGYEGRVSDLSYNGNLGKLYGDTKFLLDFDLEKPNFYVLGKAYESMVLGLDFDNYSSNVVYDRGKFGNNGTLLNSVNCDGAGVYGKSCFFNPSLSQCVLVNANESLVLGSAFTVSVWVKPEATQGQYADILDYNHGNVPIDEGFVIQQDSWLHNQYYFSFFGSDSGWHGNSKLVALKPLEWQMLSFVYDDGRVFAYLNGEQLGEPFYDGVKIAPLHVENLTIGCMGNFVRYFNGSIDEVFVLNRSFSSSQIRDLYESSKWRVVRDMTAFGRNVSGNTSTVLLMDFDDASVRDRSLAMSSGSVFEAIWNGSGCAYGGCYGFDGVDDYVRAGSYLNFSGVNSFSISAWVKPTSFSHARYSEIVRQGNLDFLLSFQEYGTILSFGLSASSYGELDVAINPNNYLNSWHHIVAIYDGNFKRLYSDGVLIGSVATTGNVAFISKDLFIGKHPYTSVDETFNGSIDEVALYSKALSESEVLELYSSKRAEFVEFEDGVSGEAMSFGGKNDTLNISAYTFEINSSPFSYSLWVKFNDISKNQRIFDRYLEKNGELFLVNNGFVTYTFVRNSTTTNVVTSVSGNVWTHFVLVSDSSSIFLYKNGVLVSQTPIINSVGNFSVVPLYLGSNDGNIEFFNGSLDEIGIYSVALNESQVLELYESKKARFVEVEDLGSSGSGGRFVSYNNMAGVGYERMVVSPISQLSGASSVSVFARVKLLDSSSGFRQVIGQGWWTPYSKFLLRVDDGNKFMFHVHSASCSSGNCGELQPESVSVGKWYNVLGRYDSSSGVKSLFVNGNLSGFSNGQTGSLTDSNESYYVGSWEAGENLGMLIDDILVFNRSISDAEVMDLSWDYSRYVDVGRNFVDLRSCGLTIGANYTIEVGYKGKVVGDSVIN